jgi:hypothetical protein
MGERKAMRSPPVVYLDTQDYSRFGDVLRGKSDASTELIFNKIEKIRISGDAIFVFSMPLMSELLQYDEDYRDTTLKKAEAVERLCGSWALPYPTRLIAAELAIAAQRLGLLEIPSRITILSDKRNWYPRIPDIFEGLQVDISKNIETEIGMISGRANRRRAAKRLKNFDFLNTSDTIAKEISEKHGIPPEVLVKILLQFLRGQITSREASRQSLSIFAEPVSFVKTYLANPNSDGQFPLWIRHFGEVVQGILVELRDEIRPLKDAGLSAKDIHVAFSEPAKRLGLRIISACMKDASEFGIDEALYQRILTEPLILEEITSYKLMGSAVIFYIIQILGLDGQIEAKIEKSFGGDLMHSLYLPHVDLWRGDRRFSPVIQRATPRYANRVVPTLADIPTRIDAWWTAASS